ncbi:MAG: hypothetical protein RI957_225 [Verrucomicrobiota bacterium]|jgi:hypothetical protein
MASPENTAARSPFAGCLIMIILAAVAVFLISVSAYSLIRQNKEIDKFTSAAPAKLPTINIEGHEAALNDLHARLQRFRDAVMGSSDKEVAISLTVEDLNHVLATMQPLRDYRGSFCIKEIGDGFILADHTRPMNGMPGSGTMRHLNAEITLKPVLAEKTLVFQVADLKVPEKTVPREFIAQIPPYRLGADLQQDAVLGPVLQKLTAMEAKSGKLELRRKPGDVPQSTASNQQVDSAFLRILRVLICGFLIIVGLGLFFGLRAKGKKERSQSSHS